MKYQDKKVLLELLDEEIARVRNDDQYKKDLERIADELHIEILAMQ